MTERVRKAVAFYLDEGGGEITMQTAADRFGVSRESVKRGVRMARQAAAGAPRGDQAS